MSETKWHKVFTLRCGGSAERGGCVFSIDVPRRDLAQGLARMDAHAKDAAHRFDNRKIVRSFRIMEGTP